MLPKPRTANRTLFQGLPTYFGGKRTLNPWIFSRLAQCVPPEEWSKLDFIDAFMGGGSVSLQAKAYGFKSVQANDMAYRSKVLAQAFLTNQKVKLTREELLWAVQALPPDGRPGFIESTFSPSVFSSRHAEVLDRVWTRAQQVACPHRQSLLLTLLWRLASDFVCFPTSLGTSNRPYAEALDGLRPWDSLNPKRYADGTLTRLLLPPLKMVENHQKAMNKSVSGGSLATFTQLDALAFLSKTTGDLLYADPPYPGTLSYERSNHVLDSLLLGQVVESAESISPFTKSVDALDLLFEAARSIPIWALSYGNKHISCEELTAKIKRHAPKRKVDGYAKAYKHLAHVSKNTSNQELLILAY